MDTIGRIAVPALVDSGLTFPLVSDMGYGYSQEWPVVVHRFGTNDAKTEQRYQVGIGPKKHAFRRQRLSRSDLNSLFQFWEGLQGPWKTFLYPVPSPSGGTVSTRVIWEQAPLSVQYLVNACQVGFHLVEVPDPSQAPSYPVNATCTRFPSSALQTALLDQVQEIIPLVRIRVRESAVPDIYLSDRRCTVGGQLYLPRLLNIGEPGSDVLVSQDIQGGSDNLSFTFGNADRVMRDLANDTDLRRATIQLSFYQVATGTLLNLWSGYILSGTIDGSPQFRVSASNATYQVNQMYPTRNISRTCWKTFNDGVNCPYSTHGSGGDPNSCDYYFDSSNGCVAHGMTPYFGGHPASPQGVSIKDNSTGVWGIGRNRVTATSIISESVFGNALQEPWCNYNGDPTQAVWVKCMIVAVRDESDFIDSLSVIGAGPIGSYLGPLVTINQDGFRYIISPLFDDQPPHGFHVDAQLDVTRNEPGYGLRVVLGNDPQSDIFGLSAGGALQGNATAAGTAFVEIRRTDQSGIQPSTPEQHDVQIPIGEGLVGFTFDQSSATAVPGLTNPFWVAINCYLRALGLFNADYATQVATFDLDAATNAAAIADLSTTPIVGVNLERQFEFQGVLASQKPFRDWLTEILAVACGYYTWNFGKLYVGCRNNASAVDAYGVGNMLYQSLALSPVDATFERLIVDFADVEYQSQANTAEYQDKSHAAFYGRAGSPLTSRIHSVGTATLSQALRLAAIRTREEIGGVTAVEWRDARTAVWRTTLLGLNNFAGQVVSVTHPDIPGIHGTANVSGTTVTWVSGDALDPSMVGKAVLVNGVEVTVTAVDGTASFTTDSAPGDGSGVTFRIITANFRIQSWKLFKDYSIEITGRTVTDSMYDLTVGPKPMDVAPSSLPPMRYPLPLGMAWAPYQVQAAVTDALFPSEWNFDVNDSYSTLADGTVSAVVTITGKLPVNDYSTAIYGAPTIGSVTVNTTGGSIPGGITLRLTLAATDSSGYLGNIAAIALVQTAAGANTNQIVLNNISWPGSASGITGCVVFASTQDDLICEQLTGTGTPTSLTLNGPLARSTWSVPSAYVNKVRLKAKRVTSGAAYAKITAISGTQLSVAAVSDTEPFSWNSNFVGRVLSVIGRSSGSTPWANMTITAGSSSSITVSAVPETLQVGDVVVVRYAVNSFYGGNTVSEAALPWTANALVGKVLRVIAGTGRGSTPVKISSNGTGTITFTGTLTMDTTSIFVIEEAAWSWSADGTSFDNKDFQATATWQLPLSNLPNQAVLLSGFEVDTYGNESADGDQPVRETWIYGADPNVAVTPTGTQDGTNPNFTLPSTPASGSDVEVFRNGLLCQPVVEYSVSGTTLTFVSPPEAADVILVKFVSTLQ